MIGFRDWSGSSAVELMHNLADIKSNWDHFAELLAPAG